MKNFLFILILLVLTIFSCEWDQETAENDSTSTQEIPFINFSVLGSFPHDVNSFTEGFFIHEGIFYESTGGTLDYENTKSLFGILDTTSGQIDVKATLDKKRFFGEGIVLLNNKIYQLTYKSRIGFVYDARSFKELQQFAIPSAEGWGLTTNGQELIMSNGTNELLFLDPENLQFIKKISVTQNGYALDLLNELEFVDGFIYANIFTTNTIVKINSTTGEVVGKMDLTSLFNDARSSYSQAIDMNGIAFDKESNILYVTGKFWPKVYALSLNTAL